MELDEICRFCLETCKSDFETVDDNTRLVLNFVQLTLDLDVSHKPVICSVCLNHLKKCSNFKVSYLRKRNLECNIHEGTTFSSSDLSERDDSALTIETFDSNEVCYFCGSRIYSSIASLEEIKSLTSAVQIYLPEIEVNVTEDFLFCKPCYVSLQSNYSFINNCLSVENKIKEYCEISGRNSQGQVVLDNVLSFISHCELKNDIPSSLNAIKAVDSETFENKSIIDLKSEDFVTHEKQEPCEIKNEDVVVKVELGDDDDRFEETLGSLEPSEVLDIVNDCGLEKHRQTDKSMSEDTVYHRDDSTFDFICKNVSGHIWSNGRMRKVTLFICTSCAFSTIHKDALQHHALAHKNSWQTTYECSFCLYHTKHENQVQKHMKTRHKLPTTHKCDVCTYKTIYKRVLKQHALTHKTCSEVTMHKCGFCSFETKYKLSLQHHMLVHQNPSEITMHKCGVCSFETKRKTSLRKHMLTHQNPSEVTVYKCEICAFQTKHKTNLRRHILTHKNSSEVQVYKCEECVFQSKRKKSLQNHMLTHQNTSEVAVLKCDMCAFQTKRKGYLRRHVLDHKKKKVSV